MTYSEFKAEMERLLIECGKYSPDQIGAGVFLEKMADLAEQYPEYDERWENESLNEG